MTASIPITEVTLLLVANRRSVKSAGFLHFALPGPQGVTVRLNPRWVRVLLALEGARKKSTAPEPMRGWITRTQLAEAIASDTIAPELQTVSRYLSDLKRAIREEFARQGFEAAPVDFMEQAVGVGARLTIDLKVIEKDQISTGFERSG